MKQNKPLITYNENEKPIIEYFFLNQHMQAGVFENKKRNKKYIVTRKGMCNIPRYFCLYGREIVKTDEGTRYYLANVRYYEKPEWECKPINDPFYRDFFDEVGFNLR